MTNTDRIAREVFFLEELEKLEDRLGLYVWGCGCCENPTLITDPPRRGRNGVWLTRERKETTE